MTLGATRGPKGSPGSLFRSFCRFIRAAKMHAARVLQCVCELCPKIRKSHDTCAWTPNSVFRIHLLWPCLSTVTDATLGYLLLPPRHVRKEESVTGDHTTVTCYVPVTGDQKMVTCYGCRLLLPLSTRNPGCQGYRCYLMLSMLPGAP